MNITLVIDNDELSTYVDSLNRVLNGEDITNDSSDLAFSINNLKEHLEMNVIEVHKPDYKRDPIEIAELMLGYKRKMNKEMILTNVKKSYKGDGLDFCNEVAEHFMKIHPEMFIEISGGEIGDIIN